MFEPVFSAMSPLWAITNSVARVLLRPGAKRLPCPVVSVGNIVAGGVGKTELVAALAARLVKQGRRVTVASRGYGSRWEREGAVAFDVETAVSHRFPDEAIVLLKKAPGVAVCVGADRHGALTRHWEELHPDVVLLDDGYQHFALARDLDVLVHDFELRWPVLREFPGALSRARVRVALSDVPKQWRGLPWVRARYRLTGAVDAASRRHELPGEAHAFCGIGNPARFRKSLVAAGTRVTAFKTFRDHAPYSIAQARELARWAAGKPLLTTLKDYVKLAPFAESQGGVAGFEPRWVELSLELIENEQLLWSALDEALQKKPS
ncbi:MAG: tetraacyldisaccharide 4'-kinase [Deltaproteobacteria bacterium]|nr:tetraacyldisaccharide 4'-kinase [Deltaproteobacteria bacterium]